MKTMATNGQGGSWWIRVNQDDLNSRQRRMISRNLKKMIDREKNGMARLLQELKKGIRAEVVLTVYLPYSKIL